jgi:hypothetical protein
VTLAKSHCHICRQFGPVQTVKCRLCCDNHEQEYCPACARLYHSLKEAWSDAKFQELKLRRRFGPRSPLSLV